MASKTVNELRSQRWFAAADMRAFAHRQRAQQMGLRREEFMGKPVIAILNTWSDMSPCHAHLRDRAEAVKRAVWAAGGYPVELPALSLGEVMVKPTTMLYRNLLSIEVEELLRSHPIDGAVLLGGCDKTAPGLVMGALSMDIPAIFCPAGPMLSGRWKGQVLGAGTHTRKYWDDLRSGEISQEDWIDLESRMTRSHGTCNTMGTASTMTSIIDAMGLTLPGASSIPAADSGHIRMASACGERIVEMVWADRKPSRVLKRANFLNGTRVYMALGGSTNAAIHLIALARRADIELTLDDLDSIAREVPVLANIRPSGDRLMEDFYYAGGLPALLKRLEPVLDGEAGNVLGGTLSDTLASAECYDDDMIRPMNRPVTEGAALAVLKGNLAPTGAVLKPSAASPHLSRHTGRAVVFENYPDLVARIDDPALEITPDSVLVLKNAGPKGAPGMPEWGALPIPKKLLAKGVRDMLRISDARMSGTHYGTCVLHVSPESAVGGPLALVRDGDEIVLDVEARRLDVLVDNAELERRRAAWTPPEPKTRRGYTGLYQDHVTQADQGCDFAFLEGGPAQGEPDIF
ncbi:L-arabinonate dehydratase [Chelativorans sp. M5D2P16]|uniref:L-arabinonate dehydratase n=1 Tax=Chelativorans sp. M5D2P16 TaxID=3095678 RepID=UPI002ACA8162|nr:L-arabinonate dehydratase [Chelativorans sp. M5D2P16]MDZ5698562.1 L-arabinonate dehydratase [Chelativorans sp. M5D2P16]